MSRIRTFQDKVDVKKKKDRLHNHLNVDAKPIRELIIIITGLISMMLMFYVLVIFWITADAYYQIRPHSLMSSCSHFHDKRGKELPHILSKAHAAEFGGKCRVVWCCILSYALFVSFLTDRTSDKKWT